MVDQIKRRKRRTKKPDIETDDCYSILILLILSSFDIPNWHVLQFQLELWLSTLSLLIKCIALNIVVKKSKPLLSKHWE